MITTVLSLIYACKAVVLLAAAAAAAAAAVAVESRARRHATTQNSNTSIIYIIIPQFNTYELLSNITSTTSVVAKATAAADRICSGGRQPRTTAG